MRSIISFKKPDDIEALIDSIQDLTRGHALEYTTYDGEIVRLTIVHHEGPVCPECGNPIHNYGHGLCLRCWQSVKRQLELKS